MKDMKIMKGVGFFMLFMVILTGCGYSGWARHEESEREGIVTILKFQILHKSLRLLAFKTGKNEHLGMVQIS